MVVLHDTKQNILLTSFSLPSRLSRTQIQKKKYVISSYNMTISAVSVYYQNHLCSILLFVHCNIRLEQYKDSRTPFDGIHWICVSNNANRLEAKLHYNLLLQNHRHQHIHRRNQLRIAQLSHQILPHFSEIISQVS